MARSHFLWTRHPRVSLLSSPSSSAAQDGNFRLCDPCCRQHQTDNLVDRHFRRLQLNNLVLLLLSSVFHHALCVLQVCETGLVLGWQIGSCS